MYVMISSITLPEIVKIVFKIVKNVQEINMTNVYLV
jgi:hypothetical protein